MQLTSSSISLRYSAIAILLSVVVGAAEAQTLEQLFDRFLPICRDASTRSISYDKPSGDAALVLETSADDGSEESGDTEPLLYNIPLSEDQISGFEFETLLCATETLRKTGSYTSGEDAFERVWSVRLVRLADGNPIGRVTLYASAPAMKRFDESGTAPRPNREVVSWYRSFVQSNGRFLDQDWNCSRERLAFSADARTLVCSNRRYGLTGDSELPGIPVKSEPPEAVALSRDGLLAFDIRPSYDAVRDRYRGDHRIGILDLMTGRTRSELPIGEDVGHLTISSDGELLGVATAKQIEIWNLQSSKRVASREIERPIDLAFVPGSRRLLAATLERISLHEPESLNTIGSLECDDGIVGWPIEVSPDGQLLAVDCVSEAFTVWNLADGGLRKGRSSDVRGFAFSPDGHYLAVAGESEENREEVALYEVENLDRVAHWSLPNAVALVFSDDGSILHGVSWGVRSSVGDSHVNINSGPVLWNLPIATLLERHGAAFSIRFMQNGHEVPVIDHVVHLLREPFDIAVRLSKGQGLYSNTALDPPFFEFAREGHSLEKTFHEANTDLGEEENESRTLRLSFDDTHHVAWIHPDGEHSLSTLEEANSILQGQLRVSHLTLGDTSVPIEELVPSDLYMVLYAGDLATGDDEGSESGRDWIRLAFREGERE